MLLFRSALPKLSVDLRSTSTGAGSPGTRVTPCLFIKHTGPGKVRSLQAHAVTGEPLRALSDELLPLSSVGPHALTALGDHHPSEAWAWIRSAARPPSNWYDSGPGFHFAARAPGHRRTPCSST